jgi:hypothetical protein
MRPGEVGLSETRRNTALTYIASLTELFNALPLPSGKSLRWLLDQGVGFDALYKVKRGWVQFDDRGGFDFDPGMSGDPVMILKATDADETIDLVAWSARDHKVATWRHHAFALGDVDQCFNPATWFDGDALKIHAGPLSWLKADGNGITILQPRFVHAYLRNVPRLICSNELVAAMVHKRLRPPRSATKIFVEPEHIAKKEIAA